MREEFDEFWKAGGRVFIKGASENGDKWFGDHTMVWRGRQPPPNPDPPWSLSTIHTYWHTPSDQFGHHTDAHRQDQPALVPPRHQTVRHILQNVETGPRNDIACGQASFRVLTSNAFSVARQWRYKQLR